jgi:hypothetical protein
MRLVGLPEEMIARMRQSPYWKLGESLAPTLAYDAAVMGDSTIPADRFGRSPYPPLSSPARRAGSPATGCRRGRSRDSGARHEILDGQDHNVAATLWHRQWPRSPGDEQSPARGPPDVPRRTDFDDEEAAHDPGVGLVCNVFVLDMDEAREFYTDKLGLGSADGHGARRCPLAHGPLSVSTRRTDHAGRSAPPVVDGEAAEQIRSLVATGYEPRCAHHG